MFSDESCEDIPHNDTHTGMNSDWKIFTVISKLFLCLLFSGLILICVSMTFSEFVLIGGSLGGLNMKLCVLANWDMLAIIFFTTLFLSFRNSDVWFLFVSLYFPTGLSSLFRVFSIILLIY